MRLRNFTACGTVLYNEVEDPEPSSTATEGLRTFSHCAYTTRPAGTPCSLQAPVYPQHDDANNGSSLGRLDPGAARAREGPASHVCGGGSLRGMCIHAGSDAPEHEGCREVSCEAHGLCAPPVPINEGGACGAKTPDGDAPAMPPCLRSACRGGRCIPEPRPDDTPCGPAGPCGEFRCLGGACVATAEEDGVMCGPSSACADMVCVGGQCVTEKRPDGRLCWQAPGDCPRTCVDGRCIACSCAPAFMFWAGTHAVPGFQWTPFPSSLLDNSFGGYFNMLAEEVDIPPMQLPYDHNSSTSRYAAETAILVCQSCRRNMRLQPGPNMVQEGASIVGTVGLAASPVRGGTYVTLDVVMHANVTHQHYVLSWQPWASISPPPLHAPHRWSDLSGSRMGVHGASPTDAAAQAGAQGAQARGRGLLPAPAVQHSAWAFVRHQPVHWGFTRHQQVRSVHVGLYMSVASCGRVPALGPTGPASAPPATLGVPPVSAREALRAGGVATTAASGDAVGGSGAASSAAKGSE